MGSPVSYNPGEVVGEKKDDGVVLDTAAPEAVVHPPIKLSKLIEHAQALLAEHGDLDVDMTPDGEIHAPVAGFSTLMEVRNGKDVAVGVTVCDYETMVAFSGG